MWLIDYLTAYWKWHREQSKCLGYEAQIRVMLPSIDKLKITCSNLQSTNFNLNSLLEVAYSDLKKLREDNANVRQQLTNLNDSLHSPTKQQFINNLVSMLSYIPANAKLWFEVGTLLTDWAKVKGVALTQVDPWPWVYSNLPQAEIHRTDNIYRTTDIDTLKLIFDSDMQRYFKYVKEWYDCDNFAEHFKARLAYIYGINDCAYVETNKGDGPAGHAWNIVFDKEDVAWGFETQARSSTGGIWRMDTPRDFPYKKELITKFEL